MIVNQSSSLLKSQPLRCAAGLSPMAGAAAARRCLMASAASITERSSGCQMEPPSSYYYYLLIMHLSNVQSNLKLLKCTLQMEKRRPFLEGCVYSLGIDTFL